MTTPAALSDAPDLDDPRAVLHRALVMVQSFHGRAVAFAATQAVDTLRRSDSMSRADLETAVAIELDTDPENLDRLRFAVDALVAANVVKALGDGRVALNRTLLDAFASEAAR